MAEGPHGRSSGAARQFGARPGLQPQRRLCQQRGRPQLQWRRRLAALFNEQLGGQISWLIPLGLLGLAAGLWAAGRAPRTDKARAAYLLWGGWSVSALASSVSPAVCSIRTTQSSWLRRSRPWSAAALSPCGELGRRHRWLSWILPAGIVGTCWWASSLLGRTPRYLPGLAPAILVVGAVASLGIAVALAGVSRIKFLRYAAASAAVLAVLAGPTAYCVSTVSHSVTGLFAAAGPATAGSFGGGAPGSPGAPTGGPPGIASSTATSTAASSGATSAAVPSAATSAGSSSGLTRAGASGSATTAGASVQFAVYRTRTAGLTRTRQHRSLLRSPPRRRRPRRPRRPPRRPLRSSPRRRQVSRTGRSAG